MDISKAIKSIKTSLFWGDWSQDQADALRTILVEIEKMNILNEENKELRNRLEHKDSSIANIDKKTIIEKMSANDESYVRHTVYLNEEQSEFVKGTAASRGVKQSEIVRIAVDMLMDAMKE